MNEYPRPGADLMNVEWRDSSPSGLADLAHQNLDIVGLHVRIWPDGCHDRWLRYPRPGLVDKASQQRRRFAGQRYLFGAAPERAVFYVESESREMLRHSRPYPVTSFSKCHDTWACRLCHWT